MKIKKNTKIVLRFLFAVILSVIIVLGPFVILSNIYRYEISGKEIPLYLILLQIVSIVLLIFAGIKTAFQKDYPYLDITL